MLRARGRGERDKSGRRETGGTENHEKIIIHTVNSSIEDCFE